MNEDLIIESFQIEPEAWQRPIPERGLETPYDLVNLDAHWGVKFVDCFTVCVSTINGDQMIVSHHLSTLVTDRIAELDEIERKRKFDNYFERQKELRDQL